MDWITVTNGKETRRVRPRGLDDLLTQGWSPVGAKAPEEPKIPQDRPKTTRKKQS